MWRVRARHAVPLLKKGRSEVQKNDSAWVAKHHGDEWSLLGAQAGMPVLLKPTANRRQRGDGLCQAWVSGDAERLGAQAEAYATERRRQNSKAPAAGQRYVRKKAIQKSRRDAGVTEWHGQHWRSTESGVAMLFARKKNGRRQNPEKLEGEKPQVIPTEHLSGGT
jgi:hypothetical protein